MRQIERRISLLERASSKESRRVIVWDDHDGKADEQAAAFRKEHDDNTAVVLVGWLPSDPASTEVSSSRPV